MIKLIPNERANTAPLNPVPAKQFVNEGFVAQAIGMSVAFLQRDRWLHKGKRPGIPYRKIGRSVRYELNEVLAVIEERSNAHH